MIAEIINIGAELTQGDALNVNGRILGKKMAESGIKTRVITAVSDDEREIISALEIARKRARFVVTTGGLGPAKDDLAKKALAEMLHLPLIYDEEIMQRIENDFSGNDSNIPPANVSQSLLPKGAKVLENPLGKVFGILFETENNVFILLPDVPAEAQSIFETSIVPFIRGKYFARQSIKSRVLKIIGADYDEIRSKLEDLAAQHNPRLSLLSDKITVKVRITAVADNENSVNMLLDNFEEQIRQKIGADMVSAIDDRKIEDVVASLLALNKMTISTAESCTGGMLASFLTNVSGVSRYFYGGIVAYSNKAKVTLLGVDEDILSEFGAVSEQVAGQMAENAAARFGTNIGVSVSGIAGPSGGTEAKPVGTVCFGLHINGVTRTFTRHFSGTRNIIRENSALSILEELRRALIRNV